MAYKIQIECTSFNDLTFNRRPITNRNYHTMLYELAVEKDDRIEYLHILTRTSCRSRRISSGVFHLKRIEIFFNTLLTEDQFKDYIKKMNNISFYSEKNICIDFFDINRNQIVYRYKFMTIVPLAIPIMKRKSYKYSYNES